MPGSHFQHKIGIPVERLSRSNWIEQLVGAVAQALPIVRPLSHYEHDHPLRPLYHLDFPEALRSVESSLSVESLLSPTEYAQHCCTGRIETSQLAHAIEESLNRIRADELLAADPLASLQLCTRRDLRMAMVLLPETVCEYDVETWVASLIDEASLRGTAAEMAATKDFQSWFAGNETKSSKPDDELRSYLERDAIGRRMVRWNREHWANARDYATWWYCRQANRRWQPSFEGGGRMRQSISKLCPSIDEEIRRCLVPFLSAYVDPGVAAWQLSDRDGSILRAFADWFAMTPPAAFGLGRQHPELAQLLRSHASMEPLASIESSLRALRIAPLNAEDYVHDLVGIIRGWAGLLYHLAISDYPCHESVRSFSLTQFIALLLLLERGAVAQNCGSTFEHVPVAELSKTLQKQQHGDQRRVALATRQTWVFRLARQMNWSPRQLHGLRAVDWSMLHHEMNSFPRFERQWAAQRAYEQSYRQSIFAMLTTGSTARPEATATSTPKFMLITCAEPNEESIRRHVESVCPEAETVGVPGFFNLDIKVKHGESAHYVDHAPTNIRKRHLVSEVDMPPPFKRHTLEIEKPASNDSNNVVNGETLSALQSGFTIAEMATVTSRLILEAGIADRLPRIVLIMGHESSSANNFFETADSCTFCSKQDVQVNTRAFVQMANDYRVREAMRLEGVTIADTTLFVAAVHHTCSDSVSLLDAATIPASHSHEMQTIVAVIKQAAQRNALERMQKLVEQPGISAQRAWQHADNRQESGAHARPEYSLMGNAICFVGRRQLTRGLMLDRRAFLFSYDPRQDDDDLTGLARLLAINLPILANISFDYWFSRVAPEPCGAGRKAELSLVAHMGVTDRECGDLRLGLPYEMVDQHEPMRLQVIVDAAPEAVERMLIANPRANRFFTRGYMQLSVLHAGQIFDWTDGRFQLI